MSIHHLLQDTAVIYVPTIGVDAYGGDNTVWTESETFKCRLEEIRRGRKETLGRDNTRSTHRIYCNSSVLSYLSLKDVLYSDNEFYEIVNFEDLDPIINNSRLLHLEIYVKWIESGLDVDLATLQVTPLNHTFSNQDPNDITYFDFVVENIGSCTLVGGATLTDSTVFLMVTSDPTYSLTAGQTKTIQISVSSDTAGDFSDILVFTGDIGHTADVDITIDSGPFTFTDNFDNDSYINILDGDEVI